MAPVSRETPSRRGKRVCGGLARPCVPWREGKGQALWGRWASSYPKQPLRGARAHTEAGGLGRATTPAGWGAGTDCISGSWESPAAKVRCRQRAG